MAGMFPNLLHQLVICNMLFYNLAKGEFDVPLDIKLRIMIMVGDGLTNIRFSSIKEMLQRKIKSFSF
jgi:hypothetical protein